MSGTNFAFVLTLLGIAVLIVGVFVMCMVTYQEIREHIEDLKYKHEYKHRFDKPPIAECYCIDCESHNNNSGNCCAHEGWCTADNWFCWCATPRRK